MVIYLDLLLIENFIVNYFLISITCRTVNTKYSIRRNVISSLIGALSCTIILFFSLSPIQQMCLKIIVAVTMVSIPIKGKLKNSIMTIIKSFFALNFYSMVLAGVSIFLIFNDGGSIPKNSYIINFPHKKLFIAIIICYLCIERISIYIKERMSLHNLIYKVEIELKGDKKIVQAFMDTGNELMEPITKLPVIIVEDNIFNNLVIKDTEKFLIPYKVVNGQGGNLEGLKADSVKINVKGYKEIKEAIIVFCHNKLSASGEYEALLSRGIII